MKAIDAYCKYIAIKNHFHNKSYNYFKYAGKVNVNPSTFENRNDKFFFVKLAKHKDVEGFLIANMIDSDTWVGNLFSNEAEETYLNWKKRQESLTYLFKNDLSKLILIFDKNFIVDDSHPYVIKKYLSKEISIETLVILVDLTRCASHWNKKMKDDIVWDVLSNKIQKYKPFVRYDRNKMKEIVLDYFGE